MKGFTVSVFLLPLVMWGCTRGCERSSQTPAAVSPAPVAGEPAAATPQEMPMEEDCVVLIDADPDFGPPPLTVAFTSEVECSSGQVQYKWDFGDGSTAAEPNPVHTYTKAGDYTATLTVTAGQVSASDEIDITVEEEAEESPPPQ